MSVWPRRRPGHPYLAGGPLLVAHRGGSGLAPENTLHAFRNAVDRWGADMLEMDVHTTRDGEVVVIHDATVDRTTDGRGRVADLTWAEIRELDAGHGFRNGNGDFPFRGLGVRIPRFEEVLEAFPTLRMNVEAKDSRSAPVLVETILRHSAQDRVLVAAEWERNRRKVKGYPGPWGASRRQLTLFYFLLHTPLRALYTPACDALQVPPVHEGREVLTPRFLHAARLRNLPIHVWTVDEEDEMRRLLMLGVDGIQTDRPDRLARVLSEQVGRPLPPALREEG
ncbi:glycerophosphodiester phosphodiesterase [Gemmatimonadota bacterium]